MKKMSVAILTILAAGMLLAGCGKAGQEAAQPTNASETKTSAGAADIKTEDPDEASGTAETAAAEEKAGDDDFVGAVKELTEELEKGAESGKVDWAKSKQLYDEKIKSVVEARDSEAKSETAQQLDAAFKAGEEGSFSAQVVAELFDKLLQKTAFLSLRHDFSEANEKFTDKSAVKGELDEAREVYEGILKGMVEKRDTAYGTQLSAAVDGGFEQMEQAVEKGSNLDFNLGKQVVDKTLMKAFYLASGAEKGYAYKVEETVKSGKDAKAQQAEGWAFFQSVKQYLEKHDKASSDYIESQFALSNDAKNVKGDLINKAYIRAFAATAKSEYEESFENWGKDKAVITALEGALFIDVIRGDLPKALGGEDQAKALADNAQKLLDAVKAGNKDQAEAIHKTVEASLDKLAAYGK
jgi:hypothetical protein